MIVGPAVSGESARQPGDIECLWEADGLPTYPLPSAVEAAYGGRIGFPADCVYANFVSSLDGVTALDPHLVPSGTDVSGNDPADRMIMSILRATADVAVVGAGTLRVHRVQAWDAASLMPELGAAWAQLRSVLGRSPVPRLAVVTGRGNLDPEHPALVAGALVLTTDSGAARLGRALPASCSVVSLGTAIRMPEVLAAVRAEGHRVVLTEGGPHLFGELLHAGLVDELFLTLSPLIAGRKSGDERLGLVAGQHFLPERALRGTLLSVRRSQDHLFLRYRL